MLTHFGTVFAVPQIPYILRLFNAFNTPLTLLNFHKNDVANVSRETVVSDVSRGTKDGMLQNVSRGTLQVLTTVKIIL